MPQTLRGSFEQALRPLPSVVKGVQACRLPGLKCLKRCAAASSRHSGHCPSVVKGVQACRLPGLKCLKRCAAAPLLSVIKGVQACRLPGLQCLQRCAAASSRHSGHCPLLLRAFKPAVCQASNASNAGAAASSRHSGHCPLLLRAFKPAVCQASNASNAARQLRAGTQATALCC